MASGKPLPFVADSVRVLSMVTTPPEIGVGGGVGCGDGPTYDVTATIGGDRVALAAWSCISGGSAVGLKDRASRRRRG